MAVSKELVDLTLATGDQIRRMLDGADGDAKADPARSREIVDALRNLMSDGAAPNEAKAAPPHDPAALEPNGREATFRISLRLHPDVFLKGTNPILLLNELRALGECRVIAHTLEVPRPGDVQPRGVPHLVGHHSHHYPGSQRHP